MWKISVIIKLKKNTYLRCSFHDKGKPIERWGHKATGLGRNAMAAGPPKRRTRRIGDLSAFWFDRFFLLVSSSLGKGEAFSRGGKI